MSKSAKMVWAAGGVLWRRGAGDRVEIGLVHRPSYDDWTLPKGKAESGEILVATAAREIHEETGSRVRLGRHLRDAKYDLPNGNRKHVRYWAAQHIGGTFLANHEVDDLKWLDINRATKKLSYPLDRKVVGEFARLPAELHTMLLVRHAKAGRRARYRGDDRMRPLDSRGRRQAAALVDLLETFGAQRIHAANRLRCEQTLTPLADELGVAVESEPALSEEAYRRDPDAAHDRICEIAADTAAIHAVCSQGKVIPPLLRWWTERDNLTIRANRNRKGSVWVLSLLDGRLVAADHIDSPLPAESS